MGRAMFTIIAAMAELERDVIGERAAARLEYARRHGTKSGKPIGRPRAVFRHDQVLQLRGQGLSGRELLLIAPGVREVEPVNEKRSETSTSVTCTTGRANQSVIVEISSIENDFFLRLEF